MFESSAMRPAPSPVLGTVAEGFEPVARLFTRQIQRGEELGASFAVYVGDRCVVDLWGGFADPARAIPWTRDTRAVIFSVSKALTAMALHLLVERGRVEWDAPVAQYWPEFGCAGKEGISVRMLANHRAGLAALGDAIPLADCCDPAQQERVDALLARQRPRGMPGEQQAYHATTHGLYLGALVRQVCGEDIGSFLHRELLEPLGSDARLGAPQELDALTSTLQLVSPVRRAALMVRAALEEPDSAEGRITREMIRSDSLPRGAFLRPVLGPDGVAEYNGVAARRACLAWASGTASAQGLARAFLPFAQGGRALGKRYFSAASLRPLSGRQTWSERDAVLQKPIGWSQGFLKEERHLFCPDPTSFGHAGMGGALGWCAPKQKVSIGYVMNRMDWRIRSPRAVRLCRALWECEPLLDA